MWIQVKDGVITATLEERPSKPNLGLYDPNDSHDSRMMDNLVGEWYDKNKQWLQTFREVINPEVAERLLRQVVAPVGEWKSGDVPGVERSVIPPGLYRVEAEAEVITQLKTVSGKWVYTFGFVPEIEEENPVCEYRQVIRIKN